MVDKMKKCLKDHSSQGCEGTEMGDGRRRDHDTINGSRPCVPCVVGVCRLPHFVCVKHVIHS